MIHLKTWDIFSTKHPKFFFLFSFYLKIFWIPLWNSTLIPLDFLLISWDSLPNPLYFRISILNSTLISTRVFTEQKATQATTAKAEQMFLLHECRFPLWFLEFLFYFRISTLNLTLICWFPHEFSQTEQKAQATQTTSKTNQKNRTSTGNKKSQKQQAEQKKQKKQKKQKHKKNRTAQAEQAKSDQAETTSRTKKQKKQNKQSSKRTASKAAKAEQKILLHECWIPLDFTLISWDPLQILFYFRISTGNKKKANEQQAKQKQKSLAWMPTRFLTGTLISSKHPKLINSPKTYLDELRWHS
jgi:type IV secretory pathway VirB10-like protein